MPSFLTLSEMLFFLDNFLLESCLLLFICNLRRRYLWQLFLQTQRLVTFLLLSSESILWEMVLEGGSSFWDLRSQNTFSFLVRSGSICSSSESESLSKCCLGNLQQRLWSDLRYLMLISIIVLILILSNFLVYYSVGLYDLINFIRRLCRTTLSFITDECRRLSITINISKIYEPTNNFNRKQYIVCIQRKAALTQAHRQLLFASKELTGDVISSLLPFPQWDELKVYIFNLILAFRQQQMMIVARSILNRSFYFATTKRGKRANQERATSEPPIEKDVFKAYRNQVEQTSVLRQFRQEVFRRSELNNEWETQRKKDTVEQKKLQELLKGQSKQESINNSKKIEARLTSRRNIFHENESKSLISDYGDYTSYNKVYPTIEDRNLESNQFLNHEHITENMYKFVDKLPDTYEEKSNLKKQMESLPFKFQEMTLSQYGKLVQKKMNTQQDMAALMQEEARIHEADKMLLDEPIMDDDVPEEDVPHPYTGTVKSVDPWNEQEHMEATLSPKAVDTIYELYLQGWTVRDISKRFGILPARTKFCVWVRAQLYHEVIPKMGVKYYMRGLRYEQKYNNEQAFCDYGLDLEELNNEGIVEQITEWNGQMLDAERKEDEYLGAMCKLVEQKRYPKYEMVQVGTHDKQNSKYRLKEWVIFRGKGSDEYFLKNKALRTLTKAQRKFNKVYY